MLRKLFRDTKRSVDLWLVFLTAVLLRLQYFITTPVTERSYDLGGHVEYITYVFNTWKIPLSNMGWEMHQPPLYYFLSAVWLHAEKLLGTPSELAWKNLQLLSLFLSIITLGISLSIVLRLFPRQQDRTKALVCLGVLAVLPGLVFFSTRISNDVLSTLLIFGVIATMLEWWKTGAERPWYACVALLSLAILTKLTAVFLVPVLLICLVFRPDTPIYRKFYMGSAAILLIMIATVCFVALRIQDGFYWRLLMPGNPGMNGLLVFQYDIKDFFSFSPTRILATTYNATWTDEFGRKYFWEFLFKSAFFGEWNFPTKLQWLHRGMLAGGLFTILMAAIGIWRDIKKKGADRLPLLLLLIMGLGSVLVFRLIHNSSSSQDFRFVMFVAIPIAAFAAKGLDALSPKLRNVATGIFVLFFIFCGTFILSLTV